MIDNTLNNIFYFLKKNQSYNQSVRHLEYQKAFAGCNDTYEKVLGLLQFVNQTQPFPRLEFQMYFLQELGSENRFGTMQSFLYQLVNIEDRLKKTEVCNVNDEPAYVNYRILFLSLQEQKGWGSKTAALFCKIIYDIHAHFPDLRFWKDAPKDISLRDELYIPVDAVILNIMKYIDEQRLSNFDNINEYIKNTWKGNDILIWDDLWFWGFISQKGSSNKRIMEFNPAKLWSFQALSKQPINLNKIELLANEFIQLIRKG